MTYQIKSMLKSMLVNKDFLTWLLIGWRFCSQPIRCQFWKFLLTNIDFNILVTRSLKYVLWLAGSSGYHLKYVNSTNNFMIIFRKMSYEFSLKLYRQLIHIFSYISLLLSGTIISWINSKLGPELLKMHVRLRADWHNYQTWLLIGWQHSLLLS